MTLIHLLFLYAVFTLSECTDPRIIGGVLSNVTQFPWVVVLQNDAPGYKKVRCTGSIIAKTWVISAAHCYRRFKDLHEVVTTIKAGTIDFKVKTNETQKRNSVRHIIYDYITSKKTDANGDVALIQVGKPFVFNEFVNFIPIAKDFPRRDNLHCISMGFGRDQPKIKGNSKLFHIKTTAGDYIYCRKMHPKWTWTEEHLCVDPVKNGTATCSGDSGGPLVCNNLLAGTLFGRQGANPDLPTPPCATPATGTYVEHHGIWGSKAIENNTVITYGQRMFTYNKTVLPIWIVNQKAGRYSGSMMWLGGEFTFGEDTVATFHRAFTPVGVWENKVDTALQWFKNASTPANVVMMYFNQPDNTSHSTGGDSAQTRAQIVNVDNIVRYLETSLSRDQLEDVNVFLVSDHGMADVTYEHILDLSADNNTVLKEVRDHYFTVGGSPIYMVAPKAGSEELVYQAFRNLSLQMGKFTVYRKADLPSDWRVKKNTRIADIIVVADIGYGFHDLQEEFKIGPGQSLGVHGYDNKLMQMHPFFQAFGPLIKKGHVIEPFNNVDLFSLWCHIIGLEDIQSDGDFKNVKNILVNSDGVNKRNKNGACKIRYNVVFMSFVVLMLHNVER